MTSKESIKQENQASLNSDLEESASKKLNEIKLSRDKKEDERLLELVDAGHHPDNLEIADLYDPRSKYKPRDKIKAVAYYMVYGSCAEVERKTNIKASTVRRWKFEAPWWQPALAWLRRQKQDELDSELTNVIHESVAEIRDRVQNGEQHLVKGEIVTVPMKGKDLAYISSILFDKRALIRGDITKISSQTVSNLEQIKQELNKHVKSLKEKDVISVQ